MNVSCSLRTKGSLKIVFFNGSDVEGELDKVEIILPGIVRCCHRCKLQPGKGVWEARPHVFDESKLLEASLFSDKTMKVFTPRRLWTDFIFDLPFFTILPLLLMLCWLADAAWWKRKQSTVLYLGLPPPSPLPPFFFPFLLDSRCQLSHR